MSPKISKRDSYLVPDLTPRDRSELKKLRARIVFVAESPHISEVVPLSKKERRPLCGSAGKAWWGALSEIAEGAASEDLSLEYFLAFCLKHRIAIANAVQFPLDSKVMKKFPDADPIKLVGCSKDPGKCHFKKASDETRAKLLRALRLRVTHPSLKSARIVALGNDADWFLRAALSPEELAARGYLKIPHPSAWWRRGGYFGRVARATLSELLSKRD